MKGVRLAPECDYVGLDKPLGCTLTMTGGGVRLERYAFATVSLPLRWLVARGSAGQILI